MLPLQTASSECRLQQSLSTPCPHEDQPSRKDSEYRRFKSEGSSAGALPAGPEMEVAIDDLSPIADARSTPPHRFNLIAEHEEEEFSAYLIAYMHRTYILFSLYFVLKLTLTKAEVEKS
ncbi:hypothetical protein ANCCEY_11383 [Ancylostoma ceylanicum]|uniref:Uncharacterized protein n=1 Tax=Ancylostoma ceylanicum TaxID=53326 RepID=A0A0D6LE95_9BILA|nr:hypothetical protein ANCCEY_11383 [Ancylostoma ceylanicum]